MSAVPGYKTTLYVGGTSTAMSGEAMSGSGAGPYQITNTAKRWLDYSVALTFYDNGVAISAGDIASIDYFFGKVTFTGSKVGPITVDGNYMPLLAVAQGKSASLKFENDMLDATVFSTSPDRLFLPGLKQLSGSLGTLDTLLTDLDSGAPSWTWSAKFGGTSPLALEIDPGGAGTAKYRCWIYLPGLTSEGAVEDLIQGNLDFQSSAQTAANGDKLSFGVGS
jgi:hypothetical protein